MSQLFGIQTQESDAALVIIPVPWEVTTSYGGGTSRGPEAILHASPQLDLHTYDKNNSISKYSIYFSNPNQNLVELNSKNKTKAQKIISFLNNNKTLDDAHKNILQEINSDCEKMVDTVYKQSKSYLSQNKKVGVVGGDHSSPLGLIKALSEVEPKYDILHIDAHLDLRDSYQGFDHSHASIMFNVLQLENPPQNLVSVGIRDYCHEEMELVKNNKNLTSFTDNNINTFLFNGGSWKNKVDEILNSLNNPTYISFDIDGLDPKYCPNTGTPVPGGLSFTQAQYLLNRIADKNKIIGFDLCEVSPSLDSTNEWDGNVGSRILFLLYKTIYK